MDLTEDLLPGTVSASSGLLSGSSASSSSSSSSAILFDQTKEKEKDADADADEEIPLEEIAFGYDDTFNQLLMRPSFMGEKILETEATITQEYEAFARPKVNPLGLLALPPTLPVKLPAASILSAEFLQEFIRLMNSEEKVGGGVAQTQTPQHRIYQQQQLAMLKAIVQMLEQKTARWNPQAMLSSSEKCFFRNLISRGFVIDSGINYSQCFQHVLIQSMQIVNGMIQLQSRVEQHINLFNSKKQTKEQEKENKDVDENPHQRLNEEIANLGMIYKNEMFDNVELMLLCCVRMIEINKDGPKQMQIVNLILKLMNLTQNVVVREQGLKERIKKSSLGVRSMVNPETVSMVQTRCFDLIHVFVNRASIDALFKHADLKLFILVFIGLANNSLDQLQLCRHDTTPIVYASWRCLLLIMKKLHMLGEMPALRECFLKIKNYFDGTALFQIGLNEKQGILQTNTQNIFAFQMFQLLYTSPTAKLTEIKKHTADIVRWFLFNVHVPETDPYPSESTMKKDVALKLSKDLWSFIVTILFEKFEEVKATSKIDDTFEWVWLNRASIFALSSEILRWDQYFDINIQIKTLVLLRAVLVVPHDLAALQHLTLATKLQKILQKKYEPEVSAKSGILKTLVTETLKMYANSEHKSKEKVQLNVVGAHAASTATSSVSTSSPSMASSLLSLHTFAALSKK